jgi:hypothetical protein
MSIDKLLKLLYIIELIIKFIKSLSDDKADEVMTKIASIIELAKDDKETV